MRRSRRSAGAISAQSAPTRSESSARLFVMLTEATRQQLMAIFASSALSLRIGRDAESGAVMLAKEPIELGLDDREDPRLDRGRPGRIRIEGHDPETLGGCCDGRDESEVREARQPDDWRVHGAVPAAAAARELRIGFSTRSLPRFPPSPFRHSIVK